MVRVRLKNRKKTEKNIYSEFPEFSKKQLDKYEELFYNFDYENKGKITLNGLKRMMEKLELPQTHLRKI